MEKLFLPGVIILVVALLYKFFPPKRQNLIYGYRTSSAMKNQETWNEANKYAANLMVLISIAIIIIGSLSYILLSLKTGINLLGISIVFMLILTIVLTELRLKSIFDKEGNRKTK
jgi:uncharacterized membrane protein